MREVLTKILSISFLLFIILYQDYYADEQKNIKNIFIFFSLRSDVPAYKNILDGIRAELIADRGTHYNIVTEYLDFLRNKDPRHLESIIELYNKKIQISNIDVLISVGPGTYQKLQKFGLVALQYCKTIIIDNADTKNEEAWDLNKDQILTVLLNYQFEQSLKTAFNLFPNYRKVYIFGGATPVDDYLYNLVKQKAGFFKNSHNFTFYSHLTFESTLNIARKISDSSLIVISSYIEDEEGLPFSTPEAVEIISSDTRVPVFTFYDTYIKKGGTGGGIGGYVFSYYNVGKETGTAVKKIIKKENIKNIKINEKKFYRYIFDWRQLKKWNILDSKAIPANSIIYNKETDFISEYGWYVAALLLFLLLQSVLIVYLVKLNRQQKIVAVQKAEVDHIMRNIIREDRMLTMVQLTASLAHELNQPLTSILYSAQAGKRFLMSEKLAPDQADEIFNNIIEDDKRAGQIINSVKSLMKLEKRDKEKVNLNTVIKETVEIFRSEAIKQNIHLTINLESTPVFIFGDKIQLQQVILNFMFNAVNAIKNSSNVTKLLEINLLLNKDFVTVSVRDNGPGIDENIIKNIFRPFITNNSEGFGIGLSVSRSIIENHDGEIWAENKPDGGAEFSFKLKVIKDE